MNISLVRLAAAFGAFLTLHVSSAFAAEPAVVIPAPVNDVAKSAGPLQKAVFAGGCFWGVQGVYQHVKGVRNALSGYAGGERSTAHYETVGTGRTGHAEAVEITYDPKEVSYGELLQIFFSVAHDPTQLNRQGPDRGPQYRSAIFFMDEAQRKLATDYIAQLDKAQRFDRPIVTQVVANSGFYPAEAYHQDFLVNNPRHGYIVYNDLPKVRNLQQLFPQVWRDDPVLVASARTSSR